MYNQPNLRHTLWTLREIFGNQSPQAISGRYIETLASFLGPDFFSNNLSDEQRWNTVFLLRLDSNFIELLETNWPLSCRFLETLAREVGPTAQAQLSASEPLQNLLNSNTWRRLVIPIEKRKILYITIQQNIVKELIKRYLPMSSSNSLTAENEYEFMTYCENHYDEVESYICSQTENNNTTTTVQSPLTPSYKSIAVAATVVAVAAATAFLYNKNN